MLKRSENGITGPPLTLISIVKPKQSVGSQVEKGWDPPGPTARPTEPDLPPGPTEPGPTVESSDTQGSTKYVSGHVQGWWL